MGWNRMGSRKGGREILRLSTTTRDKSSFQEEEDDDCFVKTIEFVCADFLILVCKRGYCNMLALALSHTN